jgi:flagellar basal body-associated protein FliL
MVFASSFLPLTSATASHLQDIQKVRNKKKKKLLAIIVLFLTLIAAAVLIAGFAYPGLFLQ